MGAYFHAAMRSGYHHLCHFNLPHYAQLCAKRGTPFPPPAQAHSEHPLVAYGPVESCMGALFTFTPDVLDAIGWADETNFFVRGLWHIDLSARACRAGFNEYSRFFDVKDSNDYLELQNTLKEQYQTSIAWESEDFKRASTKEEHDRRWNVLRMPGRVHVARDFAPEREPLRGIPAPRPIAINDVFDRVFVIDLDRRPDRLAAIAARLDNAGIAFERVQAVDGKTPEIQAEYAAYVAARRAADTSGRELSSKEFVFGYRSDAERTAHLERKLRGPAIRSAGAWSYSRTYREILLDCLEAGHERVLVLDDDGLLHRDTRAIFDRAMRQLPSDWRILQLGTLQYDWDWTRPYSENLYLPDGVVVGSHAVGFHRDVIPTLLEAVDRWTLPFDVGPLHDACRRFREKSFVIRPNLVIQDSSESDIASSDVALAEGMSETNVYRWTLKDYA
jgi:GR25 family glycosyltransferase involved in LPS biosynthesis